VLTKSLLVLGGARSGKSRYAQGLAAARFQEPTECPEWALRCSAGAFHHWNCGPAWRAFEWRAACARITEHLFLLADEVANSRYQVIGAGVRHVRGSYTRGGDAFSRYHLNRYIAASQRF
jgi:hypothetical protein